MKTSADYAADLMNTFFTRIQKKFLKKFFRDHHRNYYSTKHIDYLLLLT